MRRENYLTRAALFVIGFSVVLIQARRTSAVSNRYFAIQVIDQKTHRGVPLVELRTVSNRAYFTDSNGLVAIDEPEMMNRKVFFYVKSDGYSFPADGFGFQGKALDVSPGGRATLQIERRNIAERLYRVTGEGIYRDTILAGQRSPIDQPLLNAQVVGQDSVQAVPYHGKLYWFWGDTSRLSYPLGHFGTAGATSELPANGGLDPATGVNLRYFVDADGFSRPTCDLPGPGPKWIDGVMVVPDEKGADRMVAKYARVRGLEEVLERGLVEWDDASASWKRLAQFDLNAPLYPAGQPVRHTENGVEYFYFPVPFPVVRVRADWKSITDPRAYEAFTCLAPGTRFRKGDTTIERREDGSAVWEWKRNTAALTPTELQDLIKTKRLKIDEARFILHDTKNNRPVLIHGGSVCYNGFRKRWVLIGVEANGKTSFLGDVWYAEAEAPLGPWCNAVEIAEHEHYSFYNPVQHPFFDQEGGRLIYFEGTYASTFSGNDHPTPLYDYNQIMYRLDLSDPRLSIGGK